MRILYTIYSENGTPGGHMFSLEHLLSSLQEEIEIYVIIIGKKIPNVLSELPYKKYHVKSGAREIKEIRRIIGIIKPDVIHCFEARSYIKVSFYTLFDKYKFVVTKAGGKSPRNGFPYCNNYILFSRENYESFKSSARYKDADLHLISNRVNKKLLPQGKKEKREIFTFLQIVRFTIAKHNQILQSLNFILRLRNEGFLVKLILAGTINDEEEKIFVDNYIKINKLSDTITLITDSRVERGSDLLCMGDCIIGMGRSVMEAAILGKVVVVPNAKSNYPLLLDKDNFDELYKYNFSGRSEIVADEKEFEKIKKLIKDSNYRHNIISFISYVGKEHFELTGEIVSKYIDIYRNLRTIGSFRLLIKNFFVYIKYFAGNCF